MKKVFFISSFVFLLSCADTNKVNIPDAVLSQEKMAAVLFDVHLLEASMNLDDTNVNKLSAAGNNTNLVFDVFQKHGISKNTYDISFEFYTQHPALLSHVYELVINDLSKMQAQVMNKK